MRRTELGSRVERLRAVVVVGCLVLPGAGAASTVPAQAARVSVSADRLLVRAGPGELNVVDVRRTAGAVLVTDSGARLRPVAPCRASGTRAVRCPGGVARVRVAAGDGSDSISLEGLRLPAEVSGGGGDDVLRGGTGRDLLAGGPGEDFLDGGPGADRVGGGSGDDLVGGGAGDDRVSGDSGSDDLPADEGRDVLDGGPGTDRVSYETRRSPVDVSIDGLPDDGAVGERDNVGASVERLVGGVGDDALGVGARDTSTWIWIEGGPGRDVLGGSDGPEILHGGAGADHLVARGGPDVLHGDAGEDVLDGGAGNDLVFGNDARAERDQLTCGDGDDGASSDAWDVVAPDCERAVSPAPQTGVGVRVVRVTGKIHRPSGRRAYLVVRAQARGFNGTAIRVTVRLHGANRRTLKDTVLDVVIGRPRVVRTIRVPRRARRVSGEQYRGR